MRCMCVCVACVQVACDTNAHTPSDCVIPQCSARRFQTGERDERASGINNATYYNIFNTIHMRKIVHVMVHRTRCHSHGRGRRHRRRRRLVIMPLSLSLSRSSFVVPYRLSATVFFITINVQVHALCIGCTSSSHITQNVCTCHARGVLECAYVYICGPLRWQGI